MNKHYLFSWLLISLLTLVATLPTAWGQNFSSPTNFSMGDDPYSVAVVDVNGDSRLDIITSNTSGDNVSVLLNETPPTITGFDVAPDPICAGATTTFTATVGNVTGSYAYTLTNSTSNITGTTSSTVLSQTWTTAGSGSQTFTLTVANNGFSQTATTGLTVNTAPSLTITPAPSLSLTTGQNVTLTASGADSYSWSSGASTSVISVSVAGTYSVTGTTSGCSSVTSVTVTGGVLSMGNRVYFDQDGDGLQDTGEPGIPGVQLLLVYDANTDAIYGNANDLSFTTLTGVDGIWTVGNLAAGSYRVAATPPTGQGWAVTDAFDNGLLSASNTVTPALTVSRADVDFGFRSTGLVGSRVWVDTNGDGVQDAVEPGIPAVQLTLRYDANANNAFTDADDGSFTVLTGATGAYSFTYLPPGNYQVVVTPSTLPDNNTPTYDLDGTGTPHSATATLTLGQSLTTVNFGYSGNGTIGGRVWFDANRNGVDNAGEPGIGGISVTLVFGGNDGNLASTGDNLSYTTTTNAGGTYSFTGLFGGNLVGNTPNYRVSVMPSVSFSVQTYDATTPTTDNQSSLSLVNSGSNLVQSFGYAPPCTPVMYVTQTGAGLQTGSSWTNAFSGTALQSAIDAVSACGGGQVWVAAGVYKPTSYTGAGSRNAFFQMQNNVAIYGGFAGTETTLTGPTGRTITMPSGTTLSGEIDNDNTNTNNSYHVVVGANLNSTARLDGVVITGGNANAGTGFEQFGGGVFLFQSTNLILANCTLESNTAVFGAGLYNQVGIPSLQNCVFQNNVATNSGGGMYSHLGINMNLTNCVLQSNSAALSGGGLYSSSGNPLLTNCTLQGNSATTGGAIVVTGASNSLTLTNSIIWNNGAGNSFSVLSGSLIANYSLFEPSSITNVGLTSGPNNLTTSVSPFVSTTSVALNACSPAINAGNNLATGLTGITTDLAGNARFFNTGLVDMGAYEFAGEGQPISVSLLGSGTATCATSPTLTLNSSETGVSYQLRRNGVNTGSSVAGTGSALSFGTQPTSGTYTVLATRTGNSCTAVMATSATVVSGTGTVSVPNPITLTATQSAPFSQTFTASGGVAPHIFTLASGTLPMGLTLGTDGVLSGTPTQNGTFPITVRATDLNSCSGVSGTYLLTVASMVITALSPARNALQALATTNVAITFNQPLSTGAASLTALRVFSNQRGGLLQNGPGGSATISGNTITFDPTNNFRPGETLLTTVLSSLESTTGATLARGQVHQFTVETGGTGRGNFIAHPVNATLAVGDNPSGLVLGDIDADGDPDLITANYNSDNLSVLLNNGTGGFSLQATITVGNGPQGIVLGDLDGDGHLDLVATNNLNTTVSVLINNGTGTFANHPITATVAVGSAPRGAALGDIDGDGDLDLVTANTGPNTVSVRLNDGTGSFTAPSSNANPVVGSDPSSVALGDLDGDGDLDLVATNLGGDNLSVLLNNGAGSFTNHPTTPTVTMGDSPQGVVLGDFDGDGDLDLAAINTSSNTVPVLLNDGAGNLTPHPTRPLPQVNPTPRGLAVGDIDSDGDLDLITVSQADKFATVLLNNGTGSFTNHPFNASPRVGTVPLGDVLGDLDGDGDLDLIAINGSDDNISVLLNENPLPGFVASINPVCAGGVTTFTATVNNVSIAYNFTLTNGTATTTGTRSTSAFSQSWTATGSGSQTFTLTVGYSTTIVRSATTSLSVNAAPSPMVTASPNATLTCAQTSLTLAATGGTSYTFAGPGGGGLVSQDQSAGTAVVNQSGTYSVTVANASGCTSVTSLSISTDSSLPTASIVPISGTLTCTNPSLTLTATSSGTGLLWSTGATTTSITLNAAGTYSVTATGANGCTAVSNSVTISQDNAAPANATLTANNGAGVASNTLTCAQASLTLTANTTSTGSFTYVFDGPGTLTGSGNTRTVNTAGTYSVTITGANGCTATTSVTLYSTATTISASLVASSPITCPTPSVTLTASPANLTYAFSNGATPVVNTNQATVVSAGLYSVTVTDAGGCSAVAQVTVTGSTTAPTAPTLTASPNGTLTCAQTSLTLTASATGSSLSYVFAGPAGTLAGSGNTRPVSASGLYSVTVTGANGCTASASTTVFSNTITPTAGLVVSGTITCAVPTATLTASGASGVPGGTYSFGGPGIVSISGNLATVNVGGTYSVTVLNPANGCFATSTVSVSSDLGGAPAAPTLSASSSVVCEGTNVQVVATVGGSPTGLQWYRDGSPVAGQTSAILSLGGVQSAQAGSYVLVISGVCSVTSAPFALTVNALPTVTIIVPNGASVAGSTITLPAPLTGVNFQVLGGVSYERMIIIDRINGYEIRQVDNNTTGIFPVTRTGPFRLTVTGVGGCQRMVEGTVVVQP